MFGGNRVATLMRQGKGTAALIESLLSALGTFTDGVALQEDDITLVAVRRSRPARELATFTVASQPGNEREAMQRVAAAIGAGTLDPARLERLKTAVAEATMNAMEHGNGFRAELPATVAVHDDGSSIRVTISDLGGLRPIADAPVPDLEMKLAGEQTPRGWGLFLIRNMVDEMHVTGDGDAHTIELVIHKEGGDHVGA